ncbi:MAG: hypothetical protein J6K89_00085 [Oscillospiraceae bacterium]|nr:hypothetical protein [Oscillospiraceae bacterium]
MTSRASCFNPTLIRKNLSRYWLLSLVVFLAYLPLSHTLLSHLASKASHEFLIYEIRYLLNSYCRGTFDLFFSIASAVCVFSYLHKKRSSYFFHSLPCSCSSLFLSSYVSGIALYVLPLLLIATFTTLMIPILHGDCSRFLTGYLQIIAYRMVLYFVLYTMAALAMVLCGRGFFGVLTALLLHFLIPLLELFLLLSVESFLFGYDVLAADPVTTFLSPYLYLLPGTYRFPLELPWLELGLYAGAAALLLFLSLQLHNRRKEEAVGTSLVFSSVFSTLQYALTFLTSWILQPFFLLLGFSFLGSFSAYLLLLFGIPSFFLIRMLLLRTRKVFRKKDLLFCGIYTLVLAALLISFHVDLFGIVRKVPKAEEVQQIQVSLSNDLAFDSREPKDIEALIDLQRMILASRGAMEEKQDGSSYDTYKLSLTYTMDGEKTMERQYTLPAAYVNSAAAKVREEILTYFSHEDRYTEQLRQLQEITETLSFRQDGFSGWSFLSTAQQQDFFRALEEDLRNGADPLFLFEERASDSDKQIRLHTAGVGTVGEDRITLTLPHDATNARAFLNAVEAASKKTP